MKRRELLAALGAAALTARPPLAAAARPYRIYMATWRGMTDVEKGFQAYLEQHGVPVQYIWRDAGQNRNRVAEFQREAREMRPDLVYTWGTSATLGMAGTYDAPQLPGIPVVFALVADPVGAKIVPRLSGQERDVTGVYHVAPVGAQIEAIRAYRRFARMGVLYNPAESNSVAVAAELKSGLGRVGASLLEARFAIGSGGEPLAEGIDEHVARLKSEGAEWLYLGPDTFLYTHLDKVAAAAKRERLPTFATTEALIDAPAPVLAGLVSRYRAIGEFAAYKAEQILAGHHRARDVPVETLSRFVYIVRVEVARALDFLPPITLLNYADFR